MKKILSNIVSIIVTLLIAIVLTFVLTNAVLAISKVNDKSSSNWVKVFSSKEFWYLFNNFVKTKLKNIGYKSVFFKIENIFVK